MTATKQLTKANGDAPEVTHHPAEQPEGKALIAAVLEGKAASYTPLAEQKEITLTIGLVKKFLCVPTASGKYPTDQDCVKYIMMSMQRGLNPWAQDCYLLGYDSSSRGPTFSMVVAIQALLKRAELARTLDGGPAFDGMDSGVIVERHITGVDDEGQPVDRTEVLETKGDIVLSSDKLMGGWADVYRKDRGRPFRQRLKLETYKKPTPIWGNDSGGMICKCAEAAALRQAFPSDIGGLYLASEIEAFAEDAAKRLGGGDRGTVNLENLSNPEAPQQAAGEGFGAGHGNSEGADDERPEDVSQEPPAAHASMAEQIQPLAAGEIDPEEELNGYKFDIDSCPSIGLLNKIAKDASDASDSIKAQVQAMIADKRKELESKSKGQKNLPGA